MGNVKFGFGQILNQSPMWARWVFRGTLYLSAATAVVLGIVTEIPEEVKITILKYCLEGTALVHAFSKMFSIDVGDDPTIKKDDTQ